MDSFFIRCGMACFVRYIDLHHKSHSECDPQSRIHLATIVELTLGQHLHEKDLSTRFTLRVSLDQTSDFRSKADVEAAFRAHGISSFQADSKATICYIST